MKGYECARRKERMGVSSQVDGKRTSTPTHPPPKQRSALPPRPSLAVCACLLSLFLPGKPRLNQKKGKHTHLLRAPPPSAHSTPIFSPSRLLPGSSPSTTPWSQGRHTPRSLLAPSTDSYNPSYSYKRPSSALHRGCVVNLRASPTSHERRVRYDTDGVRAPQRPGGG